MYALFDEASRATDIFVHEPGIEALVAVNAEDPGMWLFDSALKGANGMEWLAEAGNEHRQLVALLGGLGVRVHYLTGLLAQKSVSIKFVLEGALKGAVEKNLLPQDAAEEYLQLVRQDPVTASLVGVQVPYDRYNALAEEGLSVLIPKPNAYFARDPFAIVGNCFVAMKPATWQRSGEPWLWETALQPDNSRLVRMEKTIEGGDIIISDGTVYVGIGTRTTAKAASELSQYITSGRFEGIMGVAAVLKPDAGAELGLPHTQGLPCIHLDTVMMKLSRGYMVGNKELMGACYVFDPGMPETRANLVAHIERQGLGIIPSDPGEQFTLGPNVLPVNGTVVSSGANMNTNKALERAGYKVVTFQSGTLLGGSGSAHCMLKTAVTSA